MEIRVQRQILDLYSGSSFVLERANPLLEFATLNGAKALNYTIPKTGRNLQALNYVFDDISSPQALKATIETGGAILQEGTVQIERVGFNNIDVSFVQGLSDAFTALPENMNVLLTGTTPKPAAPSVVPAANDFFCFPKINCPGYFGNGALATVNNHTAGVYNLADPLVPCFFVKKMFESITTQTGIVFKGSFFSDTSLDKLVLINLRDVRQDAEILHKNFVPDMPVSSFLKEMGIMMNLGIFINKKEVTINLADGEFIKPGPRIWFEPAEIEKKFFKKNRLVLEHSTNDAFTKDIADYTTYTATNAKAIENYVLKSAFSTVDVDAGIARIDAKGVSATNNQANEKNTFKLGFFENGTVNHTLGTRSLKPVNAGVSLSSSFWKNFEKHIANTYEVDIQIPVRGFQSALLDFHGNGGKNMVLYMRDRYYMITKQRIDLVKEIGDFTLQKLTI